MDLATIGGGIAAVGLMGLFLKDALKNNDTVHDAEHGNVHGGASIAQTLEAVEAQGLTSSKRPGGFFIAGVQTPQEKARFLRFQQETGVLVFGGPGTGKGIGFVIPTLLDRDASTPESLLVFDPAAQNIHVTGDYLRSIGYRVLYSNLTGTHAAGLQKYGAPVRMNPLGAVDLNDPLAELVIAETAATLVPVQAGSKNPYFSGTAQNLAAATGLFLRESEGVKATWPKVASLLHGSSWDMNQLFAAMKQSRYESVRATANQWYLPVDETGKLQGAPTEGMRDVLSTARRELAFLLTRTIAEMFSGGFDFAAMKQQRAAYFLVLPDSESDAMKKCAYLCLRTAKQALSTPGGYSVLWLLDEMAAALPSSGAALIRDAASLVRKYNIRIAGICQSWAQFEQWCGGNVQADALRSMFGAAIYYGANDNTSITHIMQECGKATIWAPGTNPLHQAGIEGNSAAMSVPLFFPEDLRAMISERKQILSLIGARKLCLLPRSSYLDIPALRARAAKDIYHTK